MSNGIERPLFFENQILGAADLTAVGDHSRAQQARHNRFLHLWGIAQGLELSGEDKEENQVKFKKITLSAGVAIDGTGREIVVPQAEPLSENKFSQLQLTGGVDLAKAWFPVFLIGQEQKAPLPPLANSACDNSAPTRVIEGYEVTFGRPGSARNLDEQAAGKTADGPGKGGWKILLGFVQANNKEKFVDFKYEVDGIARRYAGVQADEVAARGGALQLRTNIARRSGKPTVVLREDKDKGSVLEFGSFDSQGKPVPVFTVDAQGNVTAEGKIKGALTTGNIQVESGIATDGMILPLPPGVTEAQVTAGDAIVQSHISLRLGENAAPSSTGLTGNLAATPLETFVDAERRVHCLNRWFQLGVALPVIEDHPGVCNYVVLASVKEKSA